MAELRPFAALRYRPAVAGDLSTVLAPPFDVISPEERDALRRRNPYNIVRLELPGSDAPPGADLYEDAGATLRAWRAAGVLAQDGESAFYLYEQEFEHGGERLTRRTLFALLRLEPWDAGVVRPHERTLRAPKEDRLRLLRATRVNISPVFVLYRDPESAVGRLLHHAAGAQVAAATTADGQQHRLYAIADAGTCAGLSGAFRGLNLYIADGHHRYETALAHREQTRRAAASWSGEEAENFVLTGLTAAEDAGLLVLPIHRVVSAAPPADALRRLAESFEMEDFGPAEAGVPLRDLLLRLREAGRRGPAFAAAGLQARRFTILRARRAGGLDAAVLRHAVLERCLGLTAAELEGGALTYTEDAELAVREVLAGRPRLAFLMNPTPVEQILAIADAGGRLPQKSTFFHPKLPTGLLLNPLD